MDEPQGILIAYDMRKEKEKPSKLKQFLKHQEGKSHTNQVIPEKNTQMMKKLTLLKRSRRVLEITKVRFHSNNLI